MSVVTPFIQINKLLCNYDRYTMMSSLENYNDTFISRLILTIELFDTIVSWGDQNSWRGKSDSTIAACHFFYRFLEFVVNSASFSSTFDQVKYDIVMPLVIPYSK